MSNMYHHRGYWFGEGTDQSWRSMTPQQIRDRYVFCTKCAARMEPVDRSYKLPNGFDPTSGVQRWSVVNQVYWQCPNHIGCSDQGKLDPTSGVDATCFCGMVRHDVFPLESKAVAVGPVVR